MKRKSTVRALILSFVLAWVSVGSSMLILGPEPVNASEAATKDADYWIDRGGLFDTYGNYKAAIGCFEKVIELEPQNGHAHFYLGISYGELGDYEKSIEEINRSIELNPKNGKFFYGRGRVFLLSQDKQRAMKDFHRAAELGSQDAKDYFEYMKQFTDR
jgi:tetratricopeptide (TPR) repeat protein